MKQKKRLGLGVFESLRLRIAGGIDYIRHLVFQGEDGEWRSLRLDQELYRFEQASATLWGALEKDEEVSKVRLRWIDDKLALRTREVDRLRHLEPEKATQRFPGEEELSEAVIQLRRRRETKQAQAPIQRQLHEIDQLLDEKRTIELELVKAKMDTRAQSNCLRERAAQRATAYWVGVGLISRTTPKPKATAMFKCSKYEREVNS